MANGQLDTNLVYGVIALGAALLTLARAGKPGNTGRGWSLIGLGLLLWGGSEVLRTVSVTDATERQLDALDLAGYPLVLFGAARLVESRIKQRSATAWMDALIGALCVITLGSSLVVDYVVSETSGSGFEISMAAAYPIFDLLLLAAGAGAIALTGWRPGPALAFVSIGMIAAGAGDAGIAYESVDVAGSAAGWGAALWPVGCGLIAVGSLQRPSTLRLGVSQADGWRALASTTIFALAVLAFQLLGRPEANRSVSVALTLATIAAIIARLTLTYAENRRLVGLLQHDALTGIGNRSKLTVDLKDLLLDEEDPPPHVLTILDLDGFKSYNDAFGHPAGDALLARLAGQLDEAVSGQGTAYRLGGDEFAVVSRGDADNAKPLMEAASEALTERGEGFQITSSLGYTEMPTEAGDPDTAVQIADHRMYMHKDSRRPTPSAEVQAVVMRILQQRAPDLGRHGDAVSMLAVAIGDEMDLSPSELTALARAAELHDVGKVAIPDAILNKPGPLTEEEWGFMHQHTILGSRILGAASSLAPLGNIIRSSHERWDGKGYPDGLAGDQIPLAARIVFVCDAYDAMIQERPYAPSMTPEAALAELDRCAGTQFDPSVVAAFMRVVKSVRAAQSPNGKASASKETEGNGAKAPEAALDAHDEEFEWVEPGGNGANDPDSPAEVGSER